MLLEDVGEHIVEVIVVEGTVHLVVLAHQRWSGLGSDRLLELVDQLVVIAFRGHGRVLLNDLVVVVVGLVVVLLLGVRIGVAVGGSNKLVRVAGLARSVILILLVDRSDELVIIVLLVIILGVRLAVALLFLLKRRGFIFLVLLVLLLRSQVEEGQGILLRVLVGLLIGVLIGVLVGVLLVFLLVGVFLFEIFDLIFVVVGRLLTLFSLIVELSLFNVDNFIVVFGRSLYCRKTVVSEQVISVCGLADLGCILDVKHQIRQLNTGLFFLHEPSTSWSQGSEEQTEQERQQHPWPRLHDASVL
mmetsp:Transcript_71182/g.107651  ORF Transcript_71182/g.107651 Transcript_71182/m.107651 type:complete len:302 (-) Transcript_71182:4-909(-)